MIPVWTIGDRLRKARESAEIGTAEMAERLSVSRTTISNWEHDRRPPSVDGVRLYAQQTGVALSWFVDGRPPT